MMLCSRMLPPSTRKIALPPESWRVLSLIVQLGPVCKPEHQFSPTGAPHVEPQPVPGQVFEPPKFCSVKLASVTPPAPSASPSKSLKLAPPLDPCPPSRIV